MGLPRNKPWAKHPTNPAPGANISYLTDWGGNPMFSDMVRQARVPVTDAYTTFSGTLDPTTGMVTDLGGAAFVRITVHSARTPRESGRYVLSWTGTGTCTLFAGGDNTAVVVGSPTSNRAVYDVTFGPTTSGTVEIHHSDTTLTGIQLCLEASEGAVGPGGADEFYAPYVALHKDRYRGGIRFMTALRTNDKHTTTYQGKGANPEPITGTWATRMTDDFYTFARDAEEWYDAGLSNEGGMSYESCIRFAEKCDANPYITLPIQINDDYASQFADLMLEVMPPRMQLELELGNELWNTQFQAYHFCHEQGLVEEAANPGRLQNPTFPAVYWGVYRSYQIFEIVKAKFDAAGRGEDLVRIAAFQARQGVQNGYTKILQTDVAAIPRTDINDPPVLAAFNGFDVAATGSYHNNNLWAETQFSNNGALDDSGVKNSYTQNTKNMSNAQLLAARIVEVSACVVDWKAANAYFHSLTNADGNTLEAWIYEGHFSHDAAVGAGPTADTTLHAQLDFLHASDADGKDCFAYAIQESYDEAVFDKGYLFHSMGVDTKSPNTGDWAAHGSFDGPNTRGRWVDFALGGGREYMA